MTVLQQLPQPPAVFVDRDPLLARMSALFEAARLAGRPAYLALHGSAGVGVRSLVHQWYAREAEWFTDGSVRVPLGDGGGDALIAEALGDVLAELGERRDELPASVAARTNRLRTLTATRRMLLVLEEVDNAAQVSPFLVNAPGSAVVVISRSRLRMLDMMEFAPPLSVEPLEERYGLELFERMLGAGWFSEARVAPESVARVCGGYPLAIRATAAQIRNAPEWEAADLIRDLARRGLGALDPESQEYVRDSFDRAYRRLSAAQARAYRLVVGLYPGSTVFTDAAAVLLDQPADQTRKLLSQLAAAQLVTQVAADRFEYHDVAHWHARGVAEADEPFPEQLAAVSRVVHWYLAETVRRDRALSDRPRLGPGYRTPEPAPVTRDDALRWLEERRANLRAVVAAAERFQLPEPAWQMCEALWGVYHLHGHHEEWITTHRVGVEAARQLGDARVLMRMTSQLGSALMGVGDLDHAEEAFTESYRWAAECRDAVGAQSALEWLGKIATARGRFDVAAAHFDQSWAIAEANAPEHEKPRIFALLWLQRARMWVGAKRFDDARPAATRAVDHFRQTGESDNLAKSLLALAEAGKGDAAREPGREAAALFRADGSTRGEIKALTIVVANGGTAEEAARLSELRRAVS